MMKQVLYSLLSLGLILQPFLANAQAPSADAGKPDAPINEAEYAKDSTTEINVKNADIAAIVRIFSKKTKRNYLLDEKVKGKISIYLPGKVSAEESLRILDAVLAMKGFTSVPIGENLWKIVPSKEAKQSTIPTLTDSSEETPSAAVVTRLVNLKYVSAEEIQPFVTQLVSADGLVQAYSGTNSLIVIDSEDNIERLVRLIEELDVPFTDREMTIIAIQHAEAKDIAEKLNDILGAKKDSTGSQPGRLQDIAFNNQIPPQGIPPQGGAPGARGGRMSGRAKEPKIIADERTNSIIVVADPDTTIRIKSLTSQLDSKVDRSGNKFYVYRCQHANATELSQVLAGLAGGGSGGGTAGQTGTGGGLFGGGSNGLQNSAFGGSNSGGGLFGNSSSNRSGSGGGLFGNSGSGSGFGSGGSSFGSGGGFGNNSGGQRRQATTAQLGPNISITADPATNSLIIVANKTDYEKIKLLIEKLDVKRRQVIVEAVLLEVSIDRSVRMKTDFRTSTGGSDGGMVLQNVGTSGAGLNDLFTNPGAIQGFSVAAASAGVIKIGDALTVPTQSILVNAAQTDNNVNVLSSPTILATDNETAQIVVGQNVPFLASTGTNQTNLNNTFNQIDRQDVGITLKLVPQISSQDYVKLQIFTEVSSVVLSTLNSNFGPTTNKRQSQNTVISKDGQMIVIGGLISDEQSESEDGIPFLKDIPVLGHAFRSSSEATARKNLLIFITPRIVKDQYDVRDATIESRDKLEDVIQAYNVEPQRKEVLENRRIDEVAETKAYAGVKPSTIKGSADKLIAAEEFMANEDGMAEMNPMIADGSGDLDLTLSPSSAELPRRTVPKERAKLKDSNSVISPDMAPVFILRFTRKTDYQKSYPFLIEPSGELFSLIVPKESSTERKNFFRVGSAYKYKLGNEDVPVEVVGLFNTISEAKEFYPTLSEFAHTLTPHEILNLGKKPWVTVE